jgi:two-component system response regulator HydG
VREKVGGRRAARVLVVDDDDEMRSLVRRALEGEGHQVTERGGGGPALLALRQARFDLVILDKEMPGLNGLELLPALRREFPDLPILFVTAFGGRQVASSVLQLGARYLEKPFRLGQLREAVAELLPRPPEESEAR